MTPRGSFSIHRPIRDGWRHAAAEAVLQCFDPIGYTQILGLDAARGTRVSRMKPIRPARNLLLALSLLVCTAGTVLFGVGALTGAADADSAGKLVAGSVCEAHELKARKAEDPQLEIEIPAEFDTPWPTREACLSHAAAQDPNAPGLVQPVQFSHKHHSGTFGIDCQYCHWGADQSQAAGVPSVQVCMGCHAQFPPSYDELEGIRTLKAYWERQQPIEWLQLHRLPEHVQFRHNGHGRKGFQCQVCHGPVEQMDKVYVIADTRWWPWLLPTRTLQMGWCVDCHRQNAASNDCLTCHY